jgi:glycosyltransferase involved in cell wall biosynthesis
MYQTWPYRHVGAVFVELEFQRYRPRQSLNKLLSQYDLVQVVAGTPAWAYIAHRTSLPVCLFTATVIQKERQTLLARVPGWKRIWLKLMTLINSKIERLALSHVSYVFAESEYTRQCLRPLVGTERILLGLPGIDTTYFRPGPYQVDSYILSVGRFSDYRKNIRLLFDAYHRLRQALPQTPRLVLVGQRPLSHDWEYAASLGICDAIEMHEDIDMSTLAQLYRNASLFVLSSDEEGLGLVILEAMASGLPVVSTRCGGPETAVIEGETGYLTPVRDACALTDAMHMLLDDPALRHRMGQAGRAIAEARFSIAVAGKAYLTCYDTLLGREV